MEKMNICFMDRRAFGWIEHHLPSALPDDEVRDALQAWRGFPVIGLWSLQLLQCRP